MTNSRAARRPWVATELIMTRVPKSTMRCSLKSIFLGRHALSWVEEEIRLAFNVLCLFFLRRGTCFQSVCFFEYLLTTVLKTLTSFQRYVYSESISSKEIWSFSLFFLSIHNKLMSKNYFEKVVILTTQPHQKIWSSEVFQIFLNFLPYWVLCKKKF